MNETRIFTELLSKIVDNRGRTCPTASYGTPLIATNCVKSTNLYPTYENIRYVDNATMHSWFRGHPVPGDILLVCKGAPGQVCLVPEPIDFCIAQDMVAVRADPAKIYPPYLFAALRSAAVQDQIANMHVGTMIPHFKKGDFNKLHIPFPNRLAQLAIGDLYLELSLKIELNRRMNETLEASARALFRDWFVDFGPTRAKAEGRPAYLAPDLWSLFPDRLGDDDVPEGWAMSLVGQEFNLTMGQSPPGDTYNEDAIGLPFFQGRTDFGFRYPTRRKFCSDPTRLASLDDTLISVRAPVGDLNMAWEHCCIGRGVAAARHRSGSRSYTYYALQSIQPELEQFEHTGTVFGAINKVQFERLRIMAPHSEPVATFEKQVGGIDDQIRANIAEAATLAATRDTLLSKLMSGELRIRDAEALAV